MNKVNEASEIDVAKLENNGTANSNSHSDDENEPMWMANKLMPLLREYTEKLHQTSVKILESQSRHLEARSVKDRTFADRYRTEFELAKEYYLKLLPSAQQLVRQASQLSVHGRMPAINQLELSLRLAEFEAALDETRKRIKSGLPR